MNTHFRFISMVLTIVFCFSAIAFGQETTGAVEGTIKDPNGANVPNASVNVKSTGTTAGFNRTVTTDENGYFIVSNILPGTYTVTTTATGFTTTTQNVVISVGTTTPINGALSVGSGTENVEVVADSSTTIDPTDTKIDTNISKQVIEALPKGTTFGSLLKTAPNVRPEPLAAGFQVDGASGAENVFVIDGQEVTNFRTGQLNTNNNIPFELVQEVQIKSTGFEAEYGGATGGVINVVTTGGNDEFRGNFGASFTPSKFQGNPRPFLNRYGVNPGEVEYFNPRKDGGTNFFPVASLTGPIFKGKLWFSAIYAPQIFETSRTVDYYANGSNPNGRTISETITYNQHLKTEEAFIRLDAQPTSKLRMYGTFLYNPIIQRGVIPGGATTTGISINTEGLSGAVQQANFGGATGILRGSDFLGQQGGRQNSNNVNGQVTYTPTNNLVLNFRAGRSFLNEKLNSYGVPRAVRVICSAVPLASVATAGCTQGSQNFANNFQVNYDVSTRTTFDADASLVGINLGGRHNFKFGYQFNRLFNTVDNGYADTGIIQLFYDRNVSQVAGFGLPVSTNAIGGGLLQRFGTIGEASSRNQGVFAQDSWQIGNRLTLNLGVRLENETVPTFGEGQALKFGWGDKVAPRFGVAFDLTGDGKTKLFASYGWFYDRFKYELPRGSFGGDFFRRDYFEILPSRAAFTNYTRQAIIGTNPDLPGGNCLIANSTGFSICQADFRIPTNLVGADIFETGAIDPDIKAARQSEYTIGLERQLTNTMLLAARYTHKQVDRAVEDVGVFNAAGSEAYIIGNPGFGLVCEIATGGGYPCPKAQRDYDALEVRVDKRATKYFFNASYTYSRLFGNYSGLASSDELGRSSPNVNRFFDLPFVGFNANGDPDNGRLGTDRPHVFKAFGGYTFNFAGNSNATTVSAFTTVQSGTPLTTQYSLYSVTSAVLFRRGDLGRTELFTETDFNVAHTYKFGRDNRFSLQPFLNIRNLFNEENELTRQTTISGLNFAGGTGITGRDPVTGVIPAPTAASPNNGNPTSALVLGGCSIAANACGTEAGVFNVIFNGPGIQQYILNYLNNNNVGTLVTPFGAAAGSRVQTPVANRTQNSYGLTNGFQAPREVRFGVRLFF